VNRGLWYSIKAYGFFAGLVLVAAVLVLLGSVVLRP
jgi:hypothetical protein